MAKCNKCKADVEWVKIDNKWFCHNAGTTTDHWDSCSKNRFEKIRSTGDYFENSHDKGYFTKLKKSGIQLIESKSLIQKGKKYKHHVCDTLPWENCSHGFNL